jgi:predicted transcriptional regulator
MMIEALRRVTVRDVMTTTVESIDGNLSLNEFVEAYLLHRREQTFVVSDGVTFQGTIGIDQVRNAPREQWINQRVRDAMMPRTKIQTIDPNASGADALARLGQSESAELVVIAEDQVVGFIGQAELSRYLKLKRD